MLTVSTYVNVLFHKQLTAWFITIEAEAESHLRSTFAASPSLACLY